mmetsp:Transcript_26996/g.62188  ORF Transcript_26996/g.62188 Transcript_26996/m.62188 type:complete len:319 (-) Transcript_26996:540-1496(-)
MLSCHPPLGEPLVNLFLEGIVVEFTLLVVFFLVLVVLVVLVIAIAGAGLDTRRQNAFSLHCRSLGILRSLGQVVSPVSHLVRVLDQVGHDLIPRCNSVAVHVMVLDKGFAVKGSAIKQSATNQLRQTLCFHRGTVVLLLLDVGILFENLVVLVNVVVAVRDQLFLGHFAILVGVQGVEHRIGPFTRASAVRAALEFAKHNWIPVCQEAGHKFLRVRELGHLLANVHAGVRVEELQRRADGASFHCIRLMHVAWRENQKFSSLDDGVVQRLPGSSLHGHVASAGGVASSGVRCHHPSLVSRQLCRHDWRAHLVDVNGRS